MRVLSRLIAIAAFAVPVSRWMVKDDAAEMERYRSLSHDALLAVLQEQHRGSLGLKYFAGFVLIGGTYLVVHFGAVAVERLAKYLGLAHRS